MKYLFLLTFGLAFQAHAQQPLWQLDTKTPNCTVHFTNPDPDGKSLDADTRGQNGQWNSCLRLPTGLLKAGKDYLIVVNYEVIDRPTMDDYFYTFVRSGSLGIGADQWQTWHDDAGAAGKAQLRVVAPAAGDFYVVVGIHKQGALKITGMRIFQGNGLTSVPLTRAQAGAAPPDPTGAQPFTVVPPQNPKGPVLNLADFGALADGDSPPDAGPDRNLAAFKAAIARCKTLRASKLIVPKGVYRITSGQSIVFDSLSDFTFDGQGSTFLFHQIKGGPGMLVSNCHRTVLSHFNLDWDWNIDPLASVGRITEIGPKASYFVMHFDTKAPLDPKRWISMNPLDEQLRVPGAGQEFGDFRPTKIDSIDAQTVRVWPTKVVPAKVGQLYLLRHYTFEKHGIHMSSNTHLSLQYVNIYSFPGIGFIVEGDQHHFELLHCRITYPEGGHRCITTAADGFHVERSQGFIRLEDCDFGYMGDDCVNIHDNIHAGVQRLDAHTLEVDNVVTWICPYAADDQVEIRNGDFSPTGFTGRLTGAKSDYKKNTWTLVFDQELPAKVAPDAILFNLRYGSRNVIIRNCYFHENRARGIVGHTADWLLEGNRFYHNQDNALILLALVGSRWSEGFGAENVILRNNTFDSADCLGVGGGAAVSLQASSYGTMVRYPLINNILFDHNTFREMTGPAVAATAFTHLVFRNNIIVNEGKVPTARSMRGSIQAENGKGLWIGGNTWTTGAGIQTPALYYDSGTTQDVIIGPANLLKP